MPVEVDPPAKISWDERNDWAEVLAHFVDSGRADFKPISTTARGSVRLIIITMYYFLLTVGITGYTIVEPIEKDIYARFYTAGFRFSAPASLFRGLYLTDFHPRPCELLR